MWCIIIELSCHPTPLYPSPLSWWLLWVRYLTWTSSLLTILFVWTGLNKLKVLTIHDFVNFLTSGCWNWPCLITVLAFKPVNGFTPPPTPYSGHGSLCAGYSRSHKMEDDLNFIKMEDDLIISPNGGRP